MSCIDAAIIKALVEHIGIDPEDVPVGSPHECVKYTAGEGIAISGDNVISATDSCNCVKYTAGNGIAISGDNVISSTNACKCATVADERFDMTFPTRNLDGKNVIQVRTSDWSSMTSVLRPGDVLIVENNTTKAKEYYFFRSTDTFSSNYNVINQNGSTYNFEITSSECITTNIDASSYTAIGVFRPRTAETLSIAVMILMRFIYSNHLN